MRLRAGDRFLLLISLLTAFSLDAAGATESEPPTPDDPEGPRNVLLPRQKLFTPLVAHVHEPLFSVGVNVTRVRDSTAPFGDGNDGSVTLAPVALGGEVPLWGYQRLDGARGIQVGAFAAVQSLFSMEEPSAPLLSSDFQVGLVVSARGQSLSGRIRVQHQSRHLGDEIIENAPTIERENISFERFDGLLAWQRGVLRVYGGGSLITHTPIELDPWGLQGGIEVRGRLRPLGWSTTWRPVGAFDGEALDLRGWGSTVSVKAGVEWVAADGVRRVRFLVGYLRGYLPWGQFFRSEKVESVGLEAQVVL